MNDKKNEDESFTQLCLETYSAFAGIAGNALSQAKGDLTKTQALVLISIASAGTINMGELSYHMGISRVQASRAIMPLAERNLIERRRSPENHKVIEVSLAPKGKALLKQLFLEATDPMDQELEPLTDNEKTQLCEHAAICLRLLKKALDSRSDFSI